MVLKVVTVAAEVEPNLILKVMGVIFYFKVIYTELTRKPILAIAIAFTKMHFRTKYPRTE